MTSLVTGANGFIGRRLVERLLRDDANVVVLVRPGRRLPEAWRSRVDVVACADWSEPGLRRAIADRSFDVMFHLAAYGINPADRDIDQLLHLNVAVPATLVRLCQARGARLVMAGTFSEYLPPALPTPLDEQAPLETTRVYGASKAAGGLMARAVATTLGVDLRILRFFHVYGPGEAEHRLLPSLLSGLSQRRRVALSAGTQIRDFVHVDDVVDALVAAAAHLRSQHGPSAEIWNVCTGTGHTVREFAIMVADAMGAPHRLLGFGDRPLRPDDVAWLVGDCRRIGSELGWRPRYDLDAGVRDVVANASCGEADTPGTKCPGVSPPRPCAPQESDLA
jgi:nucleoside-diphosphate-sugar epimerase